MFCQAQSRLLYTLYLPSLINASVYSIYLPTLVHGSVSGFLGYAIAVFAKLSPGSVINGGGLWFPTFPTIFRDWGLMFPHIVNVAYKGSPIFTVLVKVFHSENLENLGIRDYSFITVGNVTIIIKILGS